MLESIILNLHNNALVLVVVIPLLFSCFAFLVGNRASLYMGFFAVALCLGFSDMILIEVKTGGVLTYYLGNWSPEIGIEYRTDSLSATFLMLVSVSALIYMIFRIKENTPLSMSVFLLAFGGLNGILVSNDAFNIYVFLEISYVALYAMAAMGDRKSLVSAFEYLIMGTIGSVFYLLGVGFLYSATGTLNLAEIASAIKLLPDVSTIKAASAFILLGLSLKLAIIPLHSWMVKLYSNSPYSFVVISSAAASKVYIYLMIRYVYSVFTYSYLDEIMSIGNVLLYAGILGALIGNICALYQREVRKILAFSSIANIGYILIVLSINTKLGFIAATVTIIFHSFTKAGLFVAVSSLNKSLSEVIDVKSLKIEDFREMGRFMPWAMSGLVLLLLSLVGMPLSLGFISKFTIITSLLDENMWLVAGLLIVLSLLPLIYSYRIIERIYFKPKIHLEPVKVLEADTNVLWLIWGLVLASVYLGIDTRLTYGLGGLISNLFVSGF